MVVLASSVVIAVVGVSSASSESRSWLRCLCPHAGLVVILVGISSRGCLCSRSCSLCQRLVDVVVVSVSLSALGSLSNTVFVVFVLVVVLSCGYLCRYWCRPAPSRRCIFSWLPLSSLLYLGGNGCLRFIHSHFQHPVFVLVVVSISLLVSRSFSQLQRYLRCCQCPLSWLLPLA